MPLPAIVTALSSDQQRLFSNVIKPKLNAYMQVTAAFGRSVPTPPGYTYPANEMNIDLVMFWALFLDVIQTLGGYDKAAQIFRSDRYVVRHFRRIVEGESPTDQDGSFWHFPSGQIPLDEAVDRELGQVIRTLRNGFAHHRWLSTHKSAADYWQELGWSTHDAPAAFNLPRRPEKNWMLYVADAGEWDPGKFWTRPGLRILVTHVHTLRYHLHLILTYLLNGEKKDIFNGQFTEFDAP